MPSGTSAATPLLGSCIDRAERRLADLCGRPGSDPWVSGSRTEYLDGDLANGLLLTYTPITAVSAVSIITGSDASGNETADSLSLTRLAVDGMPIGGTFGALVGLLHFRATGRDRILGFEWGEPLGYLSVDPGPAFSPGHYRVKVAYTGGVTATSVPYTLTQAVLLIAGNMFKQSGRYTGTRGTAEPDADVEARAMALAGPYNRPRF